MKRFLFFSFFVFFPFDVFANNVENKEWYISPRFIMQNSIITAAEIETKSNRASANGNGLSFAIGKNLNNNFRVELEYTYMSLKSATENLDFEENNNTVLFNTYTNFYANDAFSSYLVFSLGASLNSISGNMLDRTTSSISTPYSNDAFIPTFGLGLGISYAITKNFIVDLGTRILYSTPVEAEINSTTTMSGSAVPFQGIAGVRYSF